jgi:hypothetical protein
MILSDEALLSEISTFEDRRYDAMIRADVTYLSTTGWSTHTAVARAKTEPTTCAGSQPAKMSTANSRMALTGLYGLQTACRARMSGETGRAMREPTRSTIAQRSSRRCMLSNVNSASSRRRSPQPSKIANMVRLRFSVSVCPSG